MDILRGGAFLPLLSTWTGGVCRMSTLVHSRGGGGKNWVKIGPRSCWMPPKSKKKSSLQNLRGQIASKIQFRSGVSYKYQWKDVWNFWNTTFEFWVLYAEIPFRLWLCSSIFFCTQHSCALSWLSTNDLRYLFFSLPVTRFT